MSNKISIKNTKLKRLNSIYGGILKMKNLLLIVTTLSLSACVSVVSTNPHQITIVAPYDQMAKAQMLADEHCANYKSYAILKNVYAPNLIFECVKK